VVKQQKRLTRTPHLTVDNDCDLVGLKYVVRNFHRFLYALLDVVKTFSGADFYQDGRSECVVNFFVEVHNAYQYFVLADLFKRNEKWCHVKRYRFRHDRVQIV